ncbi:MAG: glycine decarboxylase subunit P [Alyxoria varia]|nr:MAG: glycine decarboxylase subunit P [Alyxoria varia]
MLATLDPPIKTLGDLMEEVMPPSIVSSRPLKIEGPPANQLLGDRSQQGYSESQLLARLRKIASQNKVFRSYIGCGYAGTRTPEVIKRNVMENPAWYTSYTPYQAEIAQGRLESLLNYQTMISDLTGLSISNASLLDEPTAAAEAMTLAINAIPLGKAKKMQKKSFFVSDKCHPQTISVLESRAHGFGVELVVGDALGSDCSAIKALGSELVGALVQYPDTEGVVKDFKAFSDIVHDQGGTFCVATDLLALTLLKSPAEFGADMAVGNAQRFGVPFGYGGPHAAFIACSENIKRKIPGRLIGVSKDRLGDKAMRLALQTREQHIRREKATSNICTAQVLLANMSAFYAIYHGPEGLRRIAMRSVAFARLLETAARELGMGTGTSTGLTNSDTVVFHVSPEKAQSLLSQARSEKAINLRPMGSGRIGITMDETVELDDVQDIIDVLAKHSDNGVEKLDIQSLMEKTGLDAQGDSIDISPEFRRQSPFLTHQVFNSYHSETELLRYIHQLQSKDLSLTHSMIPLGSCTMKLNATTEMVPVTWPEFAGLHPFAPVEQASGYSVLIRELEEDLANITGFNKISLQPNSGAQGEFTALRVIRKYLERIPGKKRDICLIPVSAHGTNPASATMVGMRVVTIKCAPDTGNLDMEDLKMKCEKYKDELGAIMVTYPSTYGVFEPKIKEVCDMVHSYGGQVFMDGANVNAQIGMCSPGEIGADACHLNLHKTFCIPHGGGGPGVGPIGVKEHLASYLPGHPLVKTGGTNAVAPVSGAPWGSAGILPISWSYIKMMGGAGLTQATRITLLNANYIMSRLKTDYMILYTNEHGRCAHEFILDVRGFKETSGIEAADIAKRLQDYGFHAPTMSWPVANTLMIEPTESESQQELDRFCDALLAIRQEVKEVEEGRQPREGNVLKMAPHSQKDLVMDDEWNRPYSRERAAYPLPYLKHKKFWPTVTRVDDGE